MPYSLAMRLALPSALALVLLGAAVTTACKKDEGITEADEGKGKKPKPPKKTTALREPAQHRKAQAARSRIELLRPTLERAAAEAQQLELPAAEALALFEELLQLAKGKE